MGRKAKIEYVRIKNKSGKSRLIRKRFQLKRKTNPLRKFKLVKEKEKPLRQRYRRRTLLSRGIKK
jgi:hypothetical protein